MIEVTENQKQEIEERFSKYEIARILGARALQIAMNAPILVKINKEELESINYDPLKIAEIEFYVGVLPITVKRPLPRRFEEKALLKKAEEEYEEKKISKKKEKKKEEKEEKVEEKVEEKEKKEGAAEEKEEKEEPAIVEAKTETKQPEEGTLEEVEQTEMVEMATPQDEIEEGAAVEEE